MIITAHSKFSLKLLRMGIFGASHGWAERGGVGGAKRYPSQITVTDILQ